MKKKDYPSRPYWLVRIAETPVGPINLWFTRKGLAALDFAEASAGEETPPPADLMPLITAVTQEIAAYVSGHGADFSSVTLDLQGTPFQLRVWQELRRIPRGAAVSYRELARRVGSPKACRAVGQANGRNPIPIIIPCHRVVAADGGLGGFSSGLEKKRWLLKHEGAL